MPRAILGCVSIHNLGLTCLLIPFIKKTPTAFEAVGVDSDLNPNVLVEF